MIATLFGGIAQARVQGDEPTTQEQRAAALEADVASYASRYGVSADEAIIRLADRQAVDEALGVVRTSRGDEFAGAYFTHENGYTVHVVRAAGHDGASIDLPQTKVLKVVYETAPHSWNELRAAQRAIGDLAASGTIDFIASGINLDSLLTGRVWVSVKNEASAEAVRKLGGNTVSVAVGDIAPEPISCTNRDNCRPVQGGLGIFSEDTYNGLSQACTTGFIARALSAGGLRWITAGHCGDESWDNQGSMIGYTGLNALDIAFSFSDTQKDVYTGTQSTPYNCVYFIASCYGITDVKGYAFMHLNDPVHAAGRKTGAADVDPGTPGVQDPEVNDLNFEYFASKAHCGNCGPNLVDGVEFDFVMQGGDSGGPVFYTSKAWGTNGATYTPGNGADGTIFMPVHNGEAGGSAEILGVAICVNSSCT